jgi:hypothetical protein
MTSFDEFWAATPRAGATGGDILRLATVAYLARYKGDSRMHTESDLRIYLAWCAERHLEPLTVQRAHVEMYVRWLQEIRRFRPSTVSRRLSVVAGFYRTCVIDGILEHSPAEHVRRPNVPPESPTLGLSHLQSDGHRQHNGDRHDRGEIPGQGVEADAAGDECGRDTAEDGERDEAHQAPPQPHPGRHLGRDQAEQVAT